MPPKSKLQKSREGNANLRVAWTGLRSTDEAPCADNGKCSCTAMHAGCCAIVLGAMCIHIPPTQRFLIPPSPYLPAGGAGAFQCMEVLCMQEEHYNVTLLQISSHACCCPPTPTLFTFRVGAGTHAHILHRSSCRYPPTPTPCRSRHVLMCGRCEANCMIPTSSVRVCMHVLIEGGALPSHPLFLRCTACICCCM
jgi:hypothetical protein